MGTHPIFESDFDCLTENSKMSDGFYSTDWDNQDTNQAYSNPAGSQNGYESTQAYNPNAYTGPVYQPDGKSMPSSDIYGGGLEDEAPLLEELGINFDHIYQKTVAVLNPWRTTDSAVINEVDLTGPFVFCMAL